MANTKSTGKGSGKAVWHDMSWRVEGVTEASVVDGDSLEEARYLAGTVSAMV